MNLEIERRDDQILLRPEGRLDLETASRFVQALDQAIVRSGAKRVVVDVKGLTYIDSAGAAVLIQGYGTARSRDMEYAIRNLTDDVRRIFMLTEGAALLEPKRDEPPAEPSAIEQIGAKTLGLWDGAKLFQSLNRETLSILGRALCAKGKWIRWDLTALYMERTGWDAIPIIFTISLLVGAVLAIQSAIQLEMYGATIFVADAVAISLTRELGPLITAIIVAGRSGSAFAAEIGAMKVNEEVDALRTMGISPVSFLVVPKLVALTAMMPCLVILADCAGVFGGFLIGCFNLDLAPAVYIDETIAALHLRDIATGLIKSVAFAIIIALIGCFRGFEVEGGADSVGQKTTSAVVSAVFLIIVADAVFTVLFDYMG